MTVSNARSFTIPRDRWITGDIVKKHMVPVEGGNRGQKEQDGYECCATGFALSQLYGMTLPALHTLSQNPGNFFESPIWLFFKNTLGLEFMDIYQVNDRKDFRRFDSELSDGEWNEKVETDLIAYFATHNIELDFVDSLDEQDEN